MKTFLKVLWNIIKFVFLAVVFVGSIGLYIFLDLISVGASATYSNKY